MQFVGASVCLIKCNTFFATERVINQKEKIVSGRVALFYRIDKSCKKSVDWWGRGYRRKNSSLDLKKWICKIVPTKCFSLANLKKKCATKNKTKKRRAKNVPKMFVHKSNLVKKRTRGCVSSKN